MARVPRAEEVRDRKRFGHLVKQLIAKHGTGERAARAIGVSQPTFSRLEAAGVVKRRLQHGVRRQPTRTDRIYRFSESVMGRLEEGLCTINQRLSHELARCVMSPAGKRLYSHVYMAWCEERSQRFRNRRGIQWTPEGPLGAPTALKRGSRKAAQARRNALLAWTAHHMQTDDECRDLWGRYQLRLVGSGASPERVKVALTRIAEPLAECADSGSVERGWSQLSRADKRKYLVHAFELELVLLRRPTDQDQAYLVADSVRIQP